MRLGRFAALLGDPVVAHHRRREADELPGVARIGDRLLVAGHAGREHGLAEGDAVDRDGAAAEHRSVLEEEIAAAHASNTSRPSATVFTTRPCSVSPSSHELAESERKPVLSDRPLGVEIERDEVGARADLDARLDEVEGSRGAGRHTLEERPEADDPWYHEVCVERAEGRLEPRDAERRLLERHVLLVTRVRRVVGRDARDRASPECVAQSLAVRARPKGRVHLRVRVEESERPPR